jgi:hypothetical protein
VLQLLRQKAAQDRRPQRLGEAQIYMDFMERAGLSGMRGDQRPYFERHGAWSNLAEREPGL